MDQNGPESNDSRSPAFGHLGYRVVELRFETQADDRLFGPQATTGRY